MIVEPGEDTKLEKGTTVDTDLTDYFAIYKPALDSTYAVPASGNAYTDVTLKAVIFAKDGKSLTVTYNEEFALVDVTAFGYIVYPIPLQSLHESRKHGFVRKPHSSLFRITNDRSDYKRNGLEHQSRIGDRTRNSDTGRRALYAHQEE